jgi:2-isopropylmalate synthase
MSGEMGQRILIYDTTLRDGTQGEEISFTTEDKIKIAKKLDEFGVDYIEGGWPGSNPKDMDFFEAMKSLPLRNAKLVAFGSTCRPASRPEDDENLASLVEAGTDVVTIFGKSWDLHVKEALSSTLDRNLELISESVRYLKSFGKEVIYDAEHFFDGYKSNRDYALATLAAAERGGADSIVLCDTNGGTLTREVYEITSYVRRVTDLPLGIHAHNDSELAVSNTIAAVEAGCVQVQGTVNGIGERCGNANLCSVMPILSLKMNRSFSASGRLVKLTELSRFVSEVSNIPHRKNLPYVGQSAFAHKGGVHVSAVMKNARTYEHIEPDLVGNSRRVLVSDLSGKSNVLFKAKELDVKLPKNNGEISAIVKEIKKLENEGYVFEDADASLRMLIEKHIGKMRANFELEALRIIIEKKAGNEKTHTEAVIKVRVGESVEHTAAEGNGPVNALDNALRKALSNFYPELSQTRLTDYKVRVVDGSKGTAAKVRVLIEASDDMTSWNTVGVSENIIEASWQALVDSINYKLMQNKDLKINETTMEVTR